MLHGIENIVALKIVPIHVAECRLIVFEVCLFFQDVSSVVGDHSDLRKACPV